ncbi:MAG: LysR substrate-binding domain-containing protein [Planctomycetota bacterium]
MRDLPSLTALLAFDAALRLESFTRAAEELGRTQGAVSRQVALLERQLGVELFVREHPRLRPTAAARSFGLELRRLLDRLSALTLEVQASGGAGAVLRLAILPAFGTRWLIPRMPRFYARFPEVSVHLTTKLGTFNFDRVGIDAAIHYGDANWPGARLEELMSEQVALVCSPDQATGVDAPSDLAGRTLLQLVSRRGAWAEWFRSHGVEGAPGGRGPLFEQHMMVIQAAVAGLGVALVPDFLVRGELASGALVEPLPEHRLSGLRSYYLAYPETSRELPGLVRFRRWILDEMKATRGEGAE